MGDNSSVQRVDKKGHCNKISCQSEQKTTNMESKTLLFGLTELKKYLEIIPARNISKLFKYRKK